MRKQVGQRTLCGQIILGDDGERQRERRRKRGYYCHVFSCFSINLHGLSKGSIDNTQDITLTTAGTWEEKRGGIAYHVVHVLCKRHGLSWTPYINLTADWRDWFGHSDAPAARIAIAIAWNKNEFTSIYVSPLHFTFICLLTCPLIWGLISLIKSIYMCLVTQLGSIHWLEPNAFPFSWII